MNNIEVIDSERSSNIPYQLCEPCYERLINHSLRPLEYFNLVAIHGHDYDLHDDFYDEDGTACQAEGAIENDETLSFPSLESLKGNLQKLIDYATVKWWYPKEVSAYLKHFNKDEILKELDNRLSYNPPLIDKFLDIVSEGLQTDAADWVIFQYKNYSGENTFIFAKALAQCVPNNAGFPIVTEMLSKAEPSKLHTYIWTLFYFQSKETLTWIEENSAKIKNVTSHFGDVCAASQFDWATAKKWLLKGRPLSLIALDALLACGTTKGKLNRSLFLRENPPRLINPDSIDRMNKALGEYLKIDNVHRPRTTIEAIKRDWKDIIKLSPTTAKNH